MTSYALVEGRFVPIEGEKNNKCPQSPALSIDSTDTGYLSEDSSNCSLAEALKESSDFYFDMSDRWKQAFVQTLDDPIYPEPEPKEEARAPPPGLSLRGLFSRQP